MLAGAWKNWGTNHLLTLALVAGVAPGAGGVLVAFLPGAGSSGAAGGEVRDALAVRVGLAGHLPAAARRFRSLLGADQLHGCEAGRVSHAGSSLEALPVGRRGWAGGPRLPLPGLHLSLLGLGGWHCRSPRGCGVLLGSHVGVVWRDYYDLEDFLLGSTRKENKAKAISAELLL